MTYNSLIIRLNAVSETIFLKQYRYGRTSNEQLMLHHPPQLYDYDISAGPSMFSVQGPLDIVPDSAH